MRKAMAAVCMLFLVPGQAHAAGARAGRYAGIHTVGIISAIGYRIDLKNLGFTVFDNSDGAIDGDEWHIDDDVTATIARSLPAGISAKPVTVDRQAFYTQDTKWFTTSQVPVEDLVAKLGDRAGIDAYIVVFPRPAADPIFESGQILRGLGVYRRAQLGHFTMGIVHRDEPDNPAAYAIYQIDIIDARTGKTIAHSAARKQETRFFATENPWSSIPASAWGATGSSLGDSQKQAIRAAIVGLIDKSLPWTLTDLGLSPQAPAVADTTTH